MLSAWIAFVSPVGLACGFSSSVQFGMVDRGGSLLIPYQKHSIYDVKADYLRGHGVARPHSGGDQEEPADIDKVDTAINSKRFLGMLIMVDMLATLVLMMAHWADSCCCHMKIPGQHAFSTREKRSYWKRLLKGVVFFPTCFVTLRQIRFNF